MAEHHASIEWTTDGGEFTRGRYSRKHTWSFDGGVTVAASPAPAVVPEPWSDPAAVDPEEAFVASLAACHMLTFLHVASRKKFEVRSYRDDAVGTMAKGENGVPWVATVTLQPRIEYGESGPTAEEERELHHLAHEQCFIANSVKTEVKVEAGG